MKDCLIIGPPTALMYNDVYPLLRDKELKAINHHLTRVYEEQNARIDMIWFSTLQGVSNKKLFLTKTYNPQDYPRYDNYDAIEVSRIKNIPYDYGGVMGVPITILQYDLNNVEIVKFRKGEDDKDLRVNGKDEYFRVLIKKNFEIDGLLYGEYTKIDGEYIKGHRPVLNGKQLYSRVLIKLKK